MPFAGTERYCAAVDVGCVVIGSLSDRLSVCATVGAVVTAFMRRSTHLSRRPGERAILWVRVWGDRSGAHTARRAGRGSLAGDRLGFRAADGARAASMPDRATACRPDRTARSGAQRRVLHGAADQRRMPLRRARAGEVVRRRHRPEVREVRQSPASGAPSRLYAGSGRGIRRCGASGSGSSSRSRATATWTG